MSSVSGYQRPLPTRDSEFEEVALRLAEAGALDDEFARYMGTQDAERERVCIRAAIGVVEEVLGREAKVTIQRCPWPQASSWWWVLADRWSESKGLGR